MRTCLWFDGQGEAAARFYCSLLPRSRVEAVFAPEPGKPALVVDFTLGGTPYQALNGGPNFKPTEAASISVLTKDQAETDRLWDALLADGGSPSACGWLKDKFGVSWQIVPETLPRLLADHDRAAGGRVMQAMMTMSKIEIAKLESAYRG